VLEYEANTDKVTQRQSDVVSTAHEVDVGGDANARTGTSMEIRKETLQCLKCFVNDIFTSGSLEDVTRDSLVVKR
jgi:hypothetical protein